MLSELGRSQMICKKENSTRNGLEKQRRQDADDVQKEFNFCRSGSAPPTIESSLSAVGGLFNHGVGGNGSFGGLPKSNNGFLSEEDLRSNPAYSSYYYSNVNLNPRLPPPLLSREDRLSTQGASARSAIGDRRKTGKYNYGTAAGSQFQVAPGFSTKKHDNDDKERLLDSVDWGGDELIGLGLDSNLVNLVGLFQEDNNNHSAASFGYPSRPAIRNDVDDTSISSLTNAPQSTSCNLVSGAPGCHSYAAVLGGSLSRSSTPDARAPSSKLTPIGAGRVENSDKRSTQSPNTLTSISSESNESRDLAASLSALSLSNCIMDNNLYPMESSITAANGAAAGFFSHSHHTGYPDSSVPNYGFTGYHEENGMSLRSLGLSSIGFSNIESPPFSDSLHLQYMRTADLNDPSVHMGSSYSDMLHKAYFEELQSQKPLYAASSPHGCYPNPAFAFPGSSLSPTWFGGAGSHLRNGGIVGLQNSAGGLVAPWHIHNTQNGFSSSLLEEFKCSKTRCLELSEIAGHVVEFSGDQYGSRFIQQKLEAASLEEKDMLFAEIFPHALTLMTDVFGNYVIQKFLEHGMAEQRRELAHKLAGHVLTLSLQMYGCRVIQKAIEVVDVDQKIKLVKELDGHVMRCVRDQNGNHVVQKCIECVPEEHVRFIVSTFFHHVVALSTHPYGCRVIQRVLEHCIDKTTLSRVMEEILSSVSLLAQDQYGNYVIQHVLEHGTPHERSTIIRELAGNIVQMSQQKFASNVVEKCLIFGDSTERQLLVNQIIGTTDENEPLQAMMKDQFANYVVQKVLETCSDQQRELILSRIKVHLTVLKKYTYGKHIVARVEKLVVAAGKFDRKMISI